MHKLKSQSGRTMIEMLGVIGLMGLLSVGAIQYISSTITKTHANDIIEAVYSRAATRTGSRFTKNILENERLTKYRYGVRVPNNDCSGVFTIPVGNIEGERAIEPALCKMLFKLVTEEDALGNLYTGNCEKITAANMEDQCEHASALRIEVSPERHGAALPAAAAPPPTAAPVDPCAGKAESVL